MNYRYKCMTCGTECVSDEEMSSCGACGSDSLTTLELDRNSSVKPRRRRAARKTTDKTGQPAPDKACLSVEKSAPDVKIVTPAGANLSAEDAAAVAAVAAAVTEEPEAPVPKGSVKCWYCGAVCENPKDYPARFCPRCGRLIAGPSPVTYRPPAKKKLSKLRSFFGAAAARLGSVLDRPRKILKKVFGKASTTETAAAVTGLGVVPVVVYLLVRALAR